MITKEQALTANEFHYGKCSVTIGPRGKRTERVYRWRRNGKTKVWVKSPNSFRVPVKYGLRGYNYIDEGTAPNWHTAEDCQIHRATEKLTRTGTGDELCGERIHHIDTGEFVYTCVAVRGTEHSHAGKGE